jgi:hypothetical protein
MEEQKPFPITPPPELMQQWDREWREQRNVPGIGWSANRLAYVAARAAQWGADQELEACCEWLQDPDLNVDTYKLRTARRPKPPSLKEQALAALNEIEDRHAGPTIQEKLIRRALEQLDD